MEVPGALHYRNTTYTDPLRNEDIILDPVKLIVIFQDCTPRFTIDFSVRAR